MKIFSRLSLIRQELESGLLILTDLVSFYIKNVENKMHLNAFLEVFEDEALDRSNKNQMDYLLKFRF